MTRLKKLKKLGKQSVAMNKTASSMMQLHSSILRSGDLIGISVRIVNWEPWYQVFHEYDAGASSSFYDGPDQDKAYRMYMDLLTAFKGVSEAEKFKKQSVAYERQIDNLVSMNKNDSSKFHNLILKSPKFLGFYS